MLFPVRLEQVDGWYRAVLLAAPDVVGTGVTRYDAIMALRAELAARVNRGEVVWVNVPQPGEPAGTPEYTEADAEMVREMVAEIYRERDAQKAAEFPE